MKSIFKFLSVLVLFVVVPELSKAQCVPDSTITELYSPTAQDGLPGGTINQNYDAVIHFNIPAETTIVVTAQIDSIVFTEINGLPVGIDYECNPGSCSFPGGSFACIRLSGIPTDTNDIGSNDLDVKFDLHTNITTVSDKITDYSIEINAGTPSGVRHFETSEKVFKTSQNPATQFSNLIFELPKDEGVSIEIFSLLGAKVSEVRIDGKSGMNMIQLNEFGLESGMYFASLRQGAFSNTVRFVLR